MALAGFGEAWIFVDPAAPTQPGGGGASLSVYRGRPPEPGQAAPPLESALDALLAAGLLDPTLVPRGAARPAGLGGRPALERDYGDRRAAEGATPGSEDASSTGRISPERRVLIRVALDDSGAIRGIAFEAEAAAWATWAPLRASLMDSFDPWSRGRAP
ncbi:MAG: hypothetical protein KDH92_01935 [Chloroflexi bacterium]|nr:hypothetical protein [Chloroflexota bacterium]